MVKPDLHDILDLGKKPLHSEPAQEQDAQNRAYTFFVEHLLPRVAGVKGWKEEMCTVALSNTKMMALDEAFTVLCCENMCTTLQDIRSQKSRRKRKRGPIEDGDPMGELPPPSWDTEAIEIPDSDDDEN